MSAFKRHQSKVFWNHMAAQDLESVDPFGARNNFTRTKQNRGTCFEIPEEEAEERSSSINESDTFETANVTAIRVCPNGNENSQDLYPTISIHEDNNLMTQTVTMDIKDEDKDDDENIAGAINRSCSPLSQDLRSLDSGFSDSERSNCSELYENETPRRRRRRKRVRDRKHGTKLGATWLEHETLPDPTYTSTPKDSRILPRNTMVLNAYTKRNVPRIQRLEEDQVDAPKIPASISFEEESLGDFLYAAEPPEDAIEPRSTNSSTNSYETESSCKSLLHSRTYRQSSSVRAWLSNLAMETESECNNTLQSKALPRRKRREFLSERDEMNDLKTLSSLATAAANKLLIRVEQFDKHYEYIFDKVSHIERGRSEKELLRAIEDDAFSVLSELGAPPPRRIQQTSLKAILSQLESIKTYVDSAVDTRLDFYIEKIVRGLEESPKDDTTVAKGALAALTALGLSGPRAGNSITRCSGIRALLTSLLTAGASSVDFVTASLRALASVCSSATAIHQFVKDGGPEILTDLLSTDKMSEKEKMEATALVVQITAPWVNALGLPYLEPFANDLIPSLNRLVESTNCGQTLLLVAAAFNHLSKSRKCAQVILEHGTVKKLLKTVKKSTGKNVWLMEQVAALISELARIPEARAHLAEARASIALVSFLRMRPPGLEDAYRRLEITAAAALTRLCVDPEIARQVVAIGGADCLPSCRVDDLLTEDEDQVEAGLLQYTKSLRKACKKAAKQIDIAKASDCSTLS
nr:PREDICTED: protein inscuteable homolog [Megachile rotundata]XP_012146666.1 PREDICTED: protein inscuteable homolog [Megachile rotundata]XP_012146668.1 PREDICTED: protein inscuteable homolog [Megachile rotundata]XP_012146669.1 PREDICTED: protein inscuteable homolog [Megachile rotundata]XP_012146670.1 PREDICTED: protein inscuteable homolog [Megachile rotundata]